MALLTKRSGEPAGAEDLGPKFVRAKEGNGGKGGDVEMLPSQAEGNPCKEGDNKGGGQPLQRAKKNGGSK